MTTETKPLKTPPTWDKKEKDAISDYGCELLVENADQKELKKTSYPSDAMIVTYKVKNKVHFDLCRGSKVNIFDLYYDKFGKGSTFPRVIKDDTLIGGCTETVKYLREQKLV